MAASQATSGDSSEGQTHFHSEGTTFYLGMLLFCCRSQLLEFGCKLFLQLLCCLQEDEEERLLGQLCAGHAAGMSLQAASAQGTQQHKGQMPLKPYKVPLTLQVFSPPRDS